MTASARSDPGAAYRGFLFSDMRGFTAFAERHGNTAAAAAVGRFLEFARTAIARHEGAEIKTEGDAIHAVFPSASGAVLCGLDIVDAAAELNTKEPSRPLGLGVGVHAGEAVETAEGYIGRAVNIAARLCAVARPGEVLVSSTVKGITQASIPVGFIPRGRRRLKGIEDPILVYAVTRDVNARAPRAVPRPIVLGAAGVAALAVIAVAAIAGSQFLANPGATAPASATAAPSNAVRTAQPVAIGALAVGSYASQEFVPPLTFDIVEQGWSANRDTAEVFGLLRVSASGGGLHFLRVREVILNPCIEGGEGTQTGPGTADVLAALDGLEQFTLANWAPAQVGGSTGQQVDVTVADGALAACGGLAGGGVAVFAAGEEVVRATPGERFRLIALKVDDQAVTILMRMDWTQIPSVQELENLYKLSGNILDSVEFQTTP